MNQLGISARILFLTALSHTHSSGSHHERNRSLPSELQDHPCLRMGYNALSRTLNRRYVYRTMGPGIKR